MPESVKFGKYRNSEIPSSLKDKRYKMNITYRVTRFALEEKKIWFDFTAVWYWYWPFLFDNHKTEHLIFLRLANILLHTKYSQALVNGNKKVRILGQENKLTFLWAVSLISILHLGVSSYWIINSNLRIKCHLACQICQQKKQSYNHNYV